MSKLVIVSSLAARQLSDGQIEMSTKFIDGVIEHQEGWGGPVTVVMEPSSKSSDSLDNVAVQVEKLPFTLVVSPFWTSATETALEGAALALLVLYQKHLPLAALCRRLGVPAVYLTEYSLSTRLQIVAAQNRGLIWRLAKVAQETLREKRYRKLISSVAGAQCNGTPTFNAYRDICAETILFFDTRVTPDLLATAQDLDAKFLRRRASGVLRLGFTGRLTAMKGVIHLVEVARYLRESGREFEMTICGEGELRPALQQEISKAALEARVTIRTPLDFKTELIPFVRDEIDIFVCCHVQGDPACTYLETMSCGVPIVGFANEAFEGLIRHSKAGWIAPMGDSRNLAAKLAALDDEEIEQQSLKSLAFATNHTFPKEFARRMEHLKRLSNAPMLQLAGR